MDESPKRGLLAAYGRLLGPLIRILIRNGVSFSEFEEVAKRSYVEIAVDHFGASDGRYARVSALTGLTADQIEETLLRAKRDSQHDQNTLDGIVRVLTVWHTDSRFTGPYGVPLELRFTDSEQPSFTDLAGENFPSIEPAKLLQQMKQTGLVVETEKGWFKVLSRRYRPEGNAPDGLEHLARTFEDLVNTVDHNLQESDPKKRLFERQVYTEDGIREEDLPRFQAFASSKANLLLEEIDNWLTQLEKPRANSGKKVSTGLGIFNYVHRDD